MEIKEKYNGNQKSITSRSDVTFFVRGFKDDRFQLEIENDNDSAYMNVGLQELTAIKQMIDEAIETHKNDKKNDNIRKTKSTN